MVLNLQISLPILVLVLSSSLIFMQFPLSLAQFQRGGFAPALATWYGPPDGPGSGNYVHFNSLIVLLSHKQTNQDTHSL